MTRTILLAVALVLAIPAQASQWTDDQVDFARHGFRNGAWDCYGRCSGRHRHRVVHRRSPSR